MALFKWGTPEVIQTVLSTELNSLANGADAVSTTAIDNETDQYEFLALELSLASLTPTTGACVYVFLVPSIDGTNYDDNGGTITAPNSALVAVFELSTSTTTKRRTARGIRLDPFKYKLVVRNAAGVSLPSSGNTVKARRYNEQVS